MQKADEILTSRLKDLQGKSSVNNSSLKAVQEWIEWADSLVMHEEDICLAKRTSVMQPKGEKVRLTALRITKLMPICKILQDVCFCVKYLK